MKKSLLFVCAAVMMVFTACEDVPAPYTIHSEGGSTIFNESFASSLGKFTTKSASGDLSWYSDYSSAVVTGYKDFDGDGKKENKAGETYLVSPFIHLENIDSAYISFSQAINYEKSTIKEDHKLLVSADYANNVATATWTELPISFNGVGGSFTFVDQEVQIPSEFMGKSIVVALKHIAHDSYSSTWEVKNFKVLKGKANESTDNPDIPYPTDENVLPYTSSSLKDGFTVVTEKGTAWSLGNSYAKATGYDSGSKTTTPSVSWLVSPAINTTKAEGNDEAVVVDFDYVLRYVGAGTDITAFHKLYASTDFTGDVTAATWTDLGFEAVESANKDWTFYAAPTLTLPAALVGQAKVYFAFRFECNAENSTTWELKNFKVHQGGKTEPTPDPEPSGDNLIANGTFETWSSGEPVYWKSASTASSATLSQSNEAHSGSYSVTVCGDAKANKRLAYKEITLKAGTYNFKFYAKAATSTAASVRPGYVPMADGKLGSYAYGDYVNDISNGEWVEVNHSFKLTSETTINLVIMNPKSPGADVLIDDAELTTSDGGLVTNDDEPGGDTGDDTNTYELVTSIESGATYVLGAFVDNVYKVAKIDSSKKYGYLYVDDVTPDNNKLSFTPSNGEELTITASGSSYTIKDATGRYVYMTGTYTSFNFDASASNGTEWTITFNDDKTANITNVEMNKTIQYSVQFKSFGSYEEITNVLPCLFKKVK